MNLNTWIHLLRLGCHQLYKPMLLHWLTSCRAVHGLYTQSVRVCVCVCVCNFGAVLHLDWWPLCTAGQRNGQWPDTQWPRYSHQHGDEAPPPRPWEHHHPRGSAPRAEGAKLVQLHLQLQLRCGCVQCMCAFVTDEYSLFWWLPPRWRLHHKRLLFFFFLIAFRTLRFVSFLFVMLYASSKSRDVFIFSAGSFQVRVCCRALLLELVQVQWMNLIYLCCPQSTCQFVFLALYNCSCRPVLWSSGILCAYGECGLFG